MRVGAVIFDYGNTLVFDPFERILKLKIKEFQNKLRKFGYNRTRKEIFKSWYEANKNINYPHITHFAQEKPIIEEALKKLGISSHLSQLTNHFLKIYREGLKNLYKKDKRRYELQSTLKNLKFKGKKLAVISNGRQFDVDNAMKWYEISNYFDLIIASETIGVEKPNEKIFKYVLERLKEQPGNGVYIGDDPVKDIDAAKKLGMRAILFIPPKKFRKEMPWRKYRVKIFNKPDAIIRNISELSKVIE